MPHLFTWLLRCLALPFLLLSANAFAEDSSPHAVPSALRTHPDLKAAEARVAAAEAQADGLSRPVYNPELDLGAERNQSQSFAAGLSQTIDLSGKRSARRASGSAELAAAITERTAQRQTLATEILKAVAELYGRTAAASLAQQRLELLERFATVADQQYRAGDIGILDRDLAALARAEAIALTGRAELELLKAQQALDAATRHPGLPPPPLPEQLPESARLRTDYEALATALPSVQSARAKVESARAETAIARSQTRVDPTLGLRGGTEQDHDGRNGEALIGLQVTIPLFLRNNFKAEVAAADAKASAAGIEAEAGYGLAVARMRATATQYGRTHDAWQRWTALSSARIDASVELLDKVWRVREISTAEYLVQFRQLLDGRAAGEELRAQTWASWAEWLDASGLWQAWLDATPASFSNPTAPIGN
jgi:outer membrane protein, heavy metal efflux system